MAIQILNMSLDSMDFQALQRPDQLSTFNDLNTVVEYVTEIVLGHIDAFPEFDNGSTSSKDYPLQKQIDLKILPVEVYSLIHQNVSLVSHLFIPMDERCTSSFCKDIIPPPPRCSSI
jgi:hypothetical protein